MQNHILVVKDKEGQIKRIIRSYESARRAGEDKALLDENAITEGESYDVVDVEYID